METVDVSATVVATEGVVTVESVDRSCDVVDPVWVNEGVVSVDPEVSVPVVPVEPDVTVSDAVDPVLVTVAVVTSLKVVPLVPVTVVWSTVEEEAGPVVALTVDDETADVVAWDVPDSVVPSDVSVAELALDSAAVVAVRRNATSLTQRYITFGISSNQTRYTLNRLLSILPTF